MYVAKIGERSARGAAECRGGKISTENVPVDSNNDDETNSYPDTIADRMCHVMFPVPDQNSCSAQLGGQHHNPMLLVIDFQIRSGYV